jgi:hypothetical protein
MTRPSVLSSGGKCPKSVGSGFVPRVLVAALAGILTLSVGTVVASAGSGRDRESVCRFQVTGQAKYYLAKFSDMFPAKNILVFCAGDEVKNPSVLLEILHRVHVKNTSTTSAFLFRSQDPFDLHTWSFKSWIKGIGDKLLPLWTRQIDGQIFGWRISTIFDKQSNQPAVAGNAGLPLVTIRKDESALRSARIGNLSIEDFFLSSGILGQVVGQNGYRNCCGGGYQPIVGIKPADYGASPLSNDTKRSPSHLYGLLCVLAGYLVTFLGSGCVLSARGTVGVIAGLGMLALGFTGIFHGFGILTG